MGTVALALVCVVLALVLSAVLVFMELKRTRDARDDRLWARLNGLDPDYKDTQWVVERNEPRHSVFQRLWEFLGVE